jgi:general secretion pathway protein D
MRAFTRTVACIILLSSVALAGDSARSIYNKAVKAEASQDYETAYELYKQLYDKHPDDLKYQVPYERTRFLAAASKVKRGQKLRDQGKVAEALEQFLRAAAIDPSNDMAVQEARRTQEIIKAQPQEGGPATTGPPLAQEEDSLHKRLEEAGGPVELGALSNVPLQALHSTADSKQIYETIGKLAGINVLFDPDYTSRRLSVDLQGITIQQALDIVALESRTFWRPVTPNTIFVAADTQTKRRELEQNVIKTFYLGNVATPTDLQDVVNAIRTILEVQRIQQIPSQNAIVVRGTPDQLTLAQKMIDDIDKSKPEVIVDVVVAQVRRDKVRQMGVLPPQNATVALQGSNTTASGTTGGTTTTTGGGLNFNNLQHLNSTNYAVTIDPLHAELLFSDSNTKILENPRVRSADGIKASLKIGDRIPIATGSFGTPLGVGTGVGALGVNTQFQYLDVGVNIDITPHVHPDGEVSLKIAGEISNQTGTSSIGGISQPIISRRSVDQEIRLKDGEMNILGGILEDQITDNNAGTPILGQIPILKYLFAQNDKERHTNEVIFLLVPHIVRSQELSVLNRREYDVGTGVGIDLRKTDKGGAKPEPLTRGQNGAPATNPVANPATTPAGTAAAGVQARPTAQMPVQQPQQTPAQPQQQTDQPASGAAQQQQTTSPLVQPGSPQQNPGALGAAGQPASMPAGTAAASGAAGSNAPDTSKPSPGTPAGPVNLRLDPPTLAPGQGSSFAVNVILSGGQDVASVPIQITYDPKVLQFVNVSNGDFLAKDGQPVALVHRDDPKSGALQVTAQRPPGSAGVTGNGVVFNLMFMAKAKGTGVISITTPGARNSQNQPLQVMGSQASVNVQ